MTPREIEWPTLAMMVATYGLWALGTVVWPQSALLSLLLCTLSIAQFSSLQHEVLHGHPFRSQKLNEALVFAGFTLFIPYERFRDTHLAHHFDPNLTDPFDDPESNYQDPTIWPTLHPAHRALLRFNNTLAGRILVGPGISSVMFFWGDMQAIRAGDTKIRRAWLLHGVGVLLVLAWLLTMGQMPLWAYVLAAYAGFGLLKIRTYLEHRAHDAFRARSVVVEDRGPLSVLFLNNNFHVVHHAHPGLAWYKLPALYAAKRDHYLRRNDNYVYKNYAQIFRAHFFRAKDPVPHPAWPVRKSDQPDA